MYCANMTEMSEKKQWARAMVQNLPACHSANPQQKDKHDPRLRGYDLMIS